MLSNYQQNEVKISNPQVISFYESNPHIQIDVINLLFIELLKSANPSSNLGSILPSIKSSGEQSSELANCQLRLKDTIHAFSKTLISQYIDAKTQYIHEFKSIDLDASDAKDQLVENNATLLNRMEQIVSPLSKFKSAISEKSANIQKQFAKIINANVESILLKDNKTTVKDYIANFETNSTHMIQTIQQLLTEYLTLKMDQIDKTIQLFNTDSESATQSYYCVFYEINDVLHQLKPNENAYPFDTLLSQVFSTASIIQEDAGYTIHRDKGPTIYVENYETRDRNVNTNEIKSFVKSCVNHGILISQFTGITSKPNYYIEIQSNRVLVYLHQMEYSADKLQIAVDMIDSISAKLSDFYSNAETKYSIPKDILDDINREYQYFVVQKETILNVLKDNYKKSVSQIDEMKFTSLDKFLSTRYSSCKKQGFTCDLCNNFHVGTLKGLAAHKRGCNRKLTRDANDKTPIYCVKSKVAEQLQM